MATVVISEENEGLMLILSSYNEGTLAWRETIKPEALSTKLAGLQKKKKMSQRDKLVWAVPEREGVRRLMVLPPCKNKKDLTGMAKSKLTLELQEVPAVVSVFPVGEGGANDVYAALAYKNESLSHRLKLARNFALRLRFVTSGDYRLADTSVNDDGYYMLEDDGEPCALAVIGGRVLDARTGNFAQTALKDAHNEVANFYLSPSVGALPNTMPSSLNDAKLLSWSVRGKVVGKGSKKASDKKLLALLALCVVLPACLLLSGGLGEKEVAEVPSMVSSEEAITAPKSDYSTLMNQAYEQKSERVTLLGQTAADGALSISGRADEVLDVADYTKKLAAVTPSLHPVLTEIKKVEEEKRYHYEFVIQISLEGGSADAA